MLRTRQLLIFLYCSGICFVFGCSHSAQGHKRCEAIISQDRLPSGWRLVPNSEMPPNDKMPWWRENPLSLEGSATKSLDEEGQPASASKVHAAVYEKDGKGVMIFCLTYPTPEAAAWMYNHIQQGPTPMEERLVGFGRGSSVTIIMLSFDKGCPDADFFVRHFREITNTVGGASKSRPGGRDN